MDERSPAAPDLELTPLAASDALTGADGADLLQLTAADAGDEAVVAEAAFAMAPAKAAAKPAGGKAVGKPATAEPPAKPSKPITAAANDSVVAALMGRPIAKAAKPASAPARQGPFSDPVPAPAPELAHIPEASPPVAAGSLVIAPVVGAPRDAVPVGVESPVATDNTAADSADALLARLEAEAAAMGVNVASGPPAVAATVAPLAAQTAHPAAPPAVVAEPVTPRPAARTRPPHRPAVPKRRAVPVAPAWPDVDASVAPRPRLPQAPRAVAVAPQRLTGTWLTLPMLFAGISVVACSILVPAADENRRDAYALAKIDRDVTYFEQQSQTNRDFLARVDTDATLAERLAMRQLHQTRPGIKTVQLPTQSGPFDASPFSLTRVDPPAPLPPYRPVPGVLGQWFLSPARQQGNIAAGLLLAGLALLIGRGREKPVS